MPNLRARQLRNHPTEAESLLWQHLRRSQTSAGSFGGRNPLGLTSSISPVSIPCWSSRLMDRSMPGPSPTMPSAPRTWNAGASKSSASGITRCSPGPIGCAKPFPHPLTPSRREGGSLRRDGVESLRCIRATVAHRSALGLFKLSSNAWTCFTWGAAPTALKYSPSRREGVRGWAIKKPRSAS